MLSRAFVLGNGKSRLQVNLDKLKSLGKIYGCNALYRDFTPDVLVATDKSMASEIEKSDYPTIHEFWTRQPIHPMSKKIDINYGFSSGPIAVSLAAKNYYDAIYLIGFDLTGNEGKINNIYAGTPNYRPLNDKETYWGNWVNQLHAIMKDQFPNIRFIRCVNNDTYTPQEWIKLKNYSEINFEEFLQSINKMSWQKQNV